MTTTTRSLIIVAAVALLTGDAIRAGAQSAPTPPRTDSVRVLPAPYTPPPPPAPSRATISQRAVRSTEATPANAPTLPARVGLPVDSARPAARNVRAQTVPEGAKTTPPPPPPVAARRTTQVVAEPVSIDGPPPAGATARCKDGTYLYTPSNERSCDNHGGLVVLITPKPAPPTPPRRP